MTTLTLIPSCSSSTDTNSEYKNEVKANIKRLNWHTDIPRAFALIKKNYEAEKLAESARIRTDLRAANVSETVINQIISRFAISMADTGTGEFTQLHPLALTTNTIPTNLSDWGWRHAGYVIDVDSVDNVIDDIITNSTGEVDWDEMSAITNKVFKPSTDIITTKLIYSIDWDANGVRKPTPWADDATYYDGQNWVSTNVGTTPFLSIKKPYNLSTLLHEVGGHYYHQKVTGGVHEQSQWGVYPMNSTYPTDFANIRKFIFGGVFGENQILANTTGKVSDAFITSWGNYTDSQQPEEFLSRVFSLLSLNKCTSFKESIAPVFDVYGLSLSLEFINWVDEEMRSMMIHRLPDPRIKILEGMEANNNTSIQLDNKERVALLEEKSYGRKTTNDLPIECGSWLNQAIELVYNDILRYNKATIKKVDPYPTTPANFNYDTFHTNILWWLDSLVGVESKWKKTAKNPNSSAYGYTQFTRESVPTAIQMYINVVERWNRTSGGDFIDRARKPWPAEDRAWEPHHTKLPKGTLLEVPKWVLDIQATIKKYPHDFQSDAALKLLGVTRSGDDHFTKTIDELSYDQVLALTLVHARKASTDDFDWIKMQNCDAEAAKRLYAIGHHTKIDTDTIREMNEFFICRRAIAKSFLDSLLTGNPSKIVAKNSCHPSGSSKTRRDIRTLLETKFTIENPSRMIAAYENIESWAVEDLSSYTSIIDYNAMTGYKSYIPNPKSSDTINIKRMTRRKLGGPATIYYVWYRDNIDYSKLAISSLMNGVDNTSQDFTEMYGSIENLTAYPIVSGDMFSGDVGDKEGVSTLKLILDDPSPEYIYNGYIPYYFSNGIPFWVVDVEPDGIIIKISSDNLLGFKSGMPLTFEHNSDARNISSYDIWDESSGYTITDAKFRPALNLGFAYLDESLMGTKFSGLSMYNKGSLRTFFHESGGHLTFDGRWGDGDTVLFTDSVISSIRSELVSFYRNKTTDRTNVNMQWAKYKALAKTSSPNAPSELAYYNQLVNKYTANYTVPQNSNIGYLFVLSQYIKANDMEFEDELLARIYAMMAVNKCVTFKHDIYPYLLQYLNISMSPDEVDAIDKVMLDDMKLNKRNI